MSALLACVYVHCIRALCPQDSEEDIRSPGTVVGGCWELNAAPLQKQQVLFTTEPSPWTQEKVSLNGISQNVSLCQEL